MITRRICTGQIAGLPEHETNGITPNKQGSSATKPLVHIEGLLTQPLFQARDLQISCNWHA